MNIFCENRIFQPWDVVDLLPCVLIIYFQRLGGQLRESREQRWIIRQKICRNILPPWVCQKNWWTCLFRGEFNTRKKEWSQWVGFSESKKKAFLISDSPMLDLVCSWQTSSLISTRHNVNIWKWNVVMGDYLWSENGCSVNCLEVIWVIDAVIQLLSSCRI